ncbi:hypothetical protein GCM10023157_33780 [Gluconacetobacter asukensis]
MCRWSRRCAPPASDLILSEVGCWPDAMDGIRLAVWGVPGNEDRNIFASPVIPLSDEAFAVVEGFILRDLYDHDRQTGRVLNSWRIRDVS